MLQRIYLIKVAGAKQHNSFFKFTETIDIITIDVLDIIDSINESLLADSHVLVSFDMVSIFPNIDNKSDLKSIKDVLLDNNFDALEICLICNNSKLIL